MNVIDLFSGAGGFSSGFLKQNFSILLGVDNDCSKSYTYFKNINPKYHLKDIKKEFIKFEKNNFNQADIDIFSKKFNISLLTKHIITQCTKNSKIDVIIGSPPCPDFSSAGNMTRTKKKKKKREYPPRHLLVNEFLRIILILSPTWFVIENVPNFFNSPIGETIIPKANLLGYSTKLLLLNARNFNIPQSRERGFLLACRDPRIDLNSINMNLYLSSNNPSIEDAISDLEIFQNKSELIPYPFSASSAYQNIMRKNEYKSPNGTSSISNHIITNSTATEKINKLISKDLNKYSKAAGTILKASNQCLSWGECIHPKLHRPYSIRECARLQSFPDDFTFYGTNSQKMCQIGDAVPPFLSEIIAKIILDLSSPFSI